MKPIDRLLALIAREDVHSDGAAARLPALRGRVCLVTGATSGHGRAVALGLARRGADVVLHGRDPARCAEVQRELQQATGRVPEVLRCDLASLADVRRAAGAYLASGRPLHVLVNNAGLVSLQRRLSLDGFELTFAVNYLAHFALTLQLLPLLAASGAAGRAARIVNVSSDTHRIVALDLDDLHEARRYGLMRAYGRSKLAIVYATRELARRLRAAGAPVTANAVDPGPVDSRIGLNHDGLLPRIHALVMRLTFPSAERAARTALQLCADPALEGTSGAYFKFGAERDPRVDFRRPALGRELWQRSVALAGVDVPALLA